MCCSHIHAENLLTQWNKVLNWMFQNAIYMRYEVFMTPCNEVLVQRCSIQPFRGRNNHCQHWILTTFWNSLSSKTSVNTYSMKCRYQVCTVYAENIFEAGTKLGNTLHWLLLTIQSGFCALQPSSQFMHFSLEWQSSTEMYEQISI